MTFTPINQDSLFTLTIWSLWFIWILFQRMQDKMQENLVMNTIYVMEMGRMTKNPGHFFDRHSGYLIREKFQNCPPMCRLFTTIHWQNQFLKWPRRTRTHTHSLNHMQKTHSFGMMYANAVSKPNTNQPKTLFA